jgi:hypothetical protein
MCHPLVDTMPNPNGVCPPGVKISGIEGDRPRWRRRCASLGRIRCAREGAKYWKRLVAQVTGFGFLLPGTVEELGTALCLLVKESPRRRAGN